MLEVIIFRHYFYIFTFLLPYRVRMNNNIEQRGNINDIIVQSEAFEYSLNSGPMKKCAG